MLPRVALALLLLPLALASELYDLHTTVEEIEDQINAQHLFHGSTVRLEHYTSEFFLHSHDVSYGSGSGQQSVTAMSEDHDYNSLWTIKECMGHPMLKYDDPVTCGACIRLEHMLTKKNLHSHQHRAPITNNQEVSCYGHDGEGDLGDNWLLQCVDQPEGTPFKASMWFFLQHHLTKRYLRASKKDYFNQKNCGYHCPIDGQLEVSCGTVKSDEVKWKVYSGLFYVKKEKTIDELDEVDECVDCAWDDYEVVDQSKQDL